MEVVANGADCPTGLYQAAAGACATGSSFSDVFQIIRPLAYGDACFLNVVTVLATGEQVVAKSYVKNRLSALEQQQLALEVQLHQEASSPHIISFYLALEDATQVHIVMELATGGDLRAALPCYPSSEELLREALVRPLLLALQELEWKGIVHRDVKPENIFLVRGQVRLGDFGLAVREAPAAASGGVDECLCRSDSAASDGAASDASSAFCLDGGAATAAAAWSPVSAGVPASPLLPLEAGGTPMYTAPEVLSARFNNLAVADVVTHKNDIWAMGLLVLETLTKHHPYAAAGAGEPAPSFMFDIIEPSCVPLPHGLSPALHAFLAAALQKDPADRPTASGLLAHDWMDAARCGAGALQTGCKAEAAASGASLWEYAPALRLTRIMSWED